MNLIEAERLVRKIIDVLQNRLSEAQARALAQAYYEACQAVNHRLVQCAAMLAQSDEHQALQLAEAPPPVLEMASRLAFRECEAWRQFCHKHDLPIAEPLEGNAIRQINAAYGKGISPDHALYRDYRQAVLLHQEDLALKALRSISWRNPADANAPRELERLERKILRGRLEELEAGLRAGDNPAVVRQVSAIEALNFQLRPGGETWRHAQQMRCRELRRLALHCRAQQRWTEAAVHLTELRTVQAEHQLTLEPAEEQEAVELERWVALCHQQEQDNERFARSVTELRQVLARHEEQQLAGELPGRAELRERLAALRHQWRELELADRPLPDDLPPRVNKLLRLLDTRLHRLERRRRNAVLAAIGAFVLVVLTLSHILWTRRQARDLAAELNDLRQRRQVAALEHRISLVRDQPSPAAASDPVKAALAGAQDFLYREQTRRQECEALLSGLTALASHDFGELAPDQVQARFDAASRGLEALADDYQPALRARFQPLQERWQIWLDTQRNARAATFTDHLRSANGFAERDLRYERGPAAVASALAALKPQLADLQRMAEPPVPRLALPTDLQAQFSALRQRVQAFALELDQWNQVQAAWRAPSSLEAYLESLRLFQRCEFAEPVQVHAAGEFLSLNVSTQALFAALLLPRSSESPVAPQPLPELKLRPDDVMPGERARLRDLRDDENIHNVRLFRRTLRLVPESQSNRVRTVYLRGSWENTRSTLQRGLIYDPVENPNELAFRRQESYSEVLFEEIGRAPEAQVFDAIGARQLLDTTATNYGGAVLAVLDRVNRDTTANPLFRAWLFLRLCELMDLRPAEWGVPWSPALAEDRKRFIELGAETLRSGDWLVPARQSAFTGSLEEHFSRARQVSYVAQAHFLAELAHRAGEAGFALVGHVDGAAKAFVPVPIADDDAELWGWTADTRSPAFLFRAQKAPGAFAPIHPPLVFSPLFRLRADPRQLVAAVRQSFGSLSSQVGAWLPPLFRGHE